jgi:site-specific DNA recombinase
MINAEIKKVAILGRISRDNGENEDVLLNNRLITTRLCESNGYTYHLYEEIISGGKPIEERPVLLQLLKDIESGLYDGLVVVDLTRIARDNLYSQMIAKVLEDNNVPIITPNRIYDLTDESDKLIYDMESMISSKELKTITRRYKSGKIERSKRGEWIQGKPPLGYKRNDVTRKLEIVPVEAETVRYIFSLAESGYGIATIKNMLANHKTREGNNFNISSIYTILSNTTYAGTITYNVKDKRGNIIEGIVTHDSHEPIIPLGQFNNVQSAIKGRLSGNMEKRNRSKGKCISILKDILYCGSCGLKMRIKHDSKNRNKIFVDKCSCGNKGISENKLLTDVWAELSIVDKQLRLTYENTLNKSTYDPKEFLIKAIGNLNKKTQVLNSSLKKLRKAYMEGIFNKEEYLSDKGDIDMELTTVNNSLSELNQKLKQLDTEAITNEYETKLKWLDDIQKIFTKYKGKQHVKGNDLKNIPSPKVEAKDIEEVNRLLKLVIYKIHYRRDESHTWIDGEGNVEVEKSPQVNLVITTR